MVARKADAETANRVLQLFLAGATYRQIAAAVGLDEAKVHQIVVAELAGAGDRRNVLNNNANEVNLERTEALFRAHWGPALSGDHKSAELCRRILERQAMAADHTVRVEGDSVDEIAQRRAARRAGTTSRSPRTKRSG